MTAPIAYTFPATGSSSAAYTEAEMNRANVLLYSIQLDRTAIPEEERAPGIIAAIGEGGDLYTSVIETAWLLNS